MEFKLTSRIRELMDQVTEKKNELVAQAAQNSEDYLHDHWSGLYPPASEPGQAPAIRSGNLNDGVQSEELVPGTWRVWVEAGYGEMLELGTVKMSPRPFWTAMLIFATYAYPEIAVASKIYNLD